MNAVLEAREPGARYLEAMRPALVRQFELLATSRSGATRLRELILRLAVQGKLVAQDPSDQTAHEILKRIQGERERLISSGAIKAPKPNKKPADGEMPFYIPPNWGWVPLGELVRVLNGRAYSKQELLDAGPTPVLRVGNLFTSDHWYYSNLKLDQDKLCRSGDLLFAWSASFGPFIWNGPEAIFHYHIWKLDPIETEFFDARFIHLFLKEKTAELKAAGHGVSMVHLTKEKMERIPVPWPPLTEQARIVARVDELMHLCDALEDNGKLEAEQHARLLRTLLNTLTDSTTPEELASNWQRVAEHFDLLLDRPEAVDALEQTILQLAVRGLLLSTEHTSGISVDAPSEQKRGANIFAAPAGWDWVLIQDIASVQGGIQKTPARRPVNHHVPYLRVANVQRDWLDLREIERFEVSLDEVERWKLIAGDLLVVEGNGSESEIGRSAIWTGVIETCVYQNHLIRVRCNPLVDPAFVQLYLNSPDGKAEMKRLAITTSGLYNLSVGKIRKFAVPLPPLSVQTRIVERVSVLRRFCSDLRQRLAAGRAVQSHLADALVEQAIS